MPPLVIFAALGAGAVMALRAIGAAQRRLEEQDKRARASIVDLKPDPTSGVYRPTDDGQV